MFNKVVIIGDSFCADRTNKETDWPLILANKLTVQLYGEGFSGQSFWSCYKWLNGHRSFKSFNQHTLIIVCHTQHERIPSRLNLPSNPGVFTDNFKNDIEYNTEKFINNLLGKSNNEFMKNRINVIKDKIFLQSQETARILKEFYMSDLYAEDFYKWAQQAWITELNSMSSEFYKIIHIKGFDENKIILENNSVLIDIEEFNSLRNLSEQELINPNYSGIDFRKNHFKDINNLVFAEKLATIIKKMPATFTGKISLNVRPEWNFEKIEFIPFRP